MGRHDVRPPNPPWKDLLVRNPVEGCFSFYLSDDLSSLAVRAVTLPNNNKSDPNLETATYGLFSTCERQMRASIVKNGLRYIFFVTNRGSQRCLTGYYGIAWYCASALTTNTASDYALAADEVHFIDPPIPLQNLPHKLRREATRRFRTFLRLGPEHTEPLTALLRRRSNQTDRYLAEIDRLERFNRFHTGFRCWRRTEPFTWETACQYLPLQLDATEPGISNTSPTDLWRCTACDQIVHNKARLKACPFCESLGSLLPIQIEELGEDSLVR